jgi:hypothetical protein
MKKIKITENQFKTLQENVSEEYLQMDELGSEEYSFNRRGRLVPGQTSGPTPEEMADIVLGKIKLHPSFYEDRDKMYAFLDIFTQKLEEDIQSGGLEKIDYDKELTTIDEPQLNEGQKELKTIYNKFI